MDIQAWKTSLQEYENEKKQVPELPKTERTTYSTIAKRENTYNPILQTYTDKTIEDNLKILEQKKMIETLAKNQDRSLRYEQTFNIINLDNKLKGLEHVQGYPSEKLSNYKNRKLGNLTNTNYNIISGLDFADHYFLPPEQRPPRQPPKIDTYKLNAVEFRDYNIITNRYFQKHDEKVAIDTESYRQEAAREYWKTHDFDPVKCTYVDEQKEIEYYERCKEKEKTHGIEKIEKLPLGIKYSEGALYQPIGMKVVDKKRLEEIDQKEKNSKKRYEHRYDIEKDYRVKDIINQELKKSQSINRISHSRFVDTIKRGYNIMNHAPFEGLGSEKLNLPATIPYSSVWEKTMIESEAPKKGGEFQKSNSQRFLRTRGFA